MPATIPHKLRITKKAKHISLKVDHRGLVVISPKQLSILEIDRLFERHRDWISKHQKRILIASEDRSIKIGSVVNLLGTEYKISQTQIPGQTVITRTESEILVPEGKDQEDLYKWLKKEAKQFIHSRVQQLAATHGFEYQSIAIRDQSSRWGSCSSAGNLNFSWRLALAPLYVLDYVALHELAHTVEMNHSASFWQVVAKCMPNYRLAKTWLKENGYKLHLY